MSDEKRKLDTAIEAVVFLVTMGVITPILIGLWRWALG